MPTWESHDARRRWRCCHALLALVAAAVLALGCDDITLEFPDSIHRRWWTGFDVQGMTNTVTALTEYHGSLYAGGFFVRAGNTDVNCVARWTGESWEAMGRGVRRHDCSRVGPCLASVNAFVTWNDMLVAGGRFTIAGGDAAQSIALWDGAIWHPIGAGFEADVHALAVWRGQLVAGGDFQMSGTDSVAHIAVWSGERWLPLGAGTAAPVTSLVEYENDLIAGSSFDRVGTRQVHQVARWDGVQWAAMELIDESDQVKQLLVYAGGLYAVGYVSEPATQLPARFGLVQWRNDAWHGVSDNLHEKPLAAACEFAGDLILATDGFGSTLWRLHGAVAEPVSSRLSNDVLALRAASGSVFVGGQFQLAGDRPSRYIARWDP